MDEKKDIGALWTRNKDGKDYMTGIITIGDVVHEIVVFANSYKKEGDKTPDWRIYPSRPRTEVKQDDDMPPETLGHNPNPDDIPF